MQCYEIDQFRRVSDSEPRSFDAEAIRLQVMVARSMLDDVIGLLAARTRTACSTIEPIKVAKSLYAQRRLRERFFPSKLFADPAWDLLLTLYVARCEGRPTSTTNACLAAGVAPTTGLRLLSIMEKAGLASRRKSERDVRVTLVEITDPAFERMTSLLLQLAVEQRPE